MASLPKVRWTTAGKFLGTPVQGAAVFMSVFIRAANLGSCFIQSSSLIGRITARPDAAVVSGLGQSLVQTLSSYRSARQGVAASRQSAVRRVFMAFSPLSVRM